MANTAALNPRTPHAAPILHAADTESPTAFSFAMLTHPGHVRRSNQDACAAAPEHAAFVVCDGVGGAAGGEVASRLATEAFLAALRQSARRPSEDLHPHTRLHQAILAANAAVLERAQKSRSLRGMATTLVAALLDPSAGLHNQQRTTHNGERTTENACPTLWLAHAGDSRAYRLRRGANGGPAKLDQLTTDHSLVEEQVRAGILTRAAAQCSPVRNVITRAVGSTHAIQPEIAAHAIQPSDLYLLASDGLTRELEDSEIARILNEVAALTRTSSVLEATARTLIDAANHHGGRDNITVLLLACR